MTSGQHHHPEPIDPDDIPRGQPVRLTTGPLREHVCQLVRLAHKRGYSDRQITIWLEEKHALLLTRRQVFYLRSKTLRLPSNGPLPRYDGDDIRTPADQITIARRVLISRMGWSHVLPGCEPEVETTTPPEPGVTIERYWHLDEQPPEESEESPPSLPVGPPPMLDLKFREAQILSLLEHNGALTKKQLADRMGLRYRRTALRSGGYSYLARLLEARLIVVHRVVVQNKRASKVYSLAPGVTFRTRTRRPDGIDLRIKSNRNKD